MTNETLFIEAVLVGAAVLLILSALILLALELADHDDVYDARLWLVARWRTIIGQSALSVIYIAVRWMRDAIDRIVVLAVVDFDRSGVLGPTVMAVVIIILPSAALLNALIGGSEVMIFGYIICLVLLIVLNGLDAMNYGVRIKTLISGTVSFLWLVYLPFHAFQSFTDHIILTPIAHSSMATVFITILCYSGAAATWMLFRTGRGYVYMGTIERYFARALFALPVMYVFYWMALLAGHISYPDYEPIRDWRTIISVLSVGSFAFALFLTFIDWVVQSRSLIRSFSGLVGTVSIAFVSVVATAVVSGRGLPFWFETSVLSQSPRLDADFWLLHIPLFPLVLMVVSIGFLSLAWSISYTANLGGWVQKRPFFATSVCAFTSGVAILIGTMTLL